MASKYCEQAFRRRNAFTEVVLRSESGLSHYAMELALFDAFLPAPVVELVV